MKNYLVKTAEEEMYVEAYNKDQVIDIVLNLLPQDVQYDMDDLDIQEVEL